MTDQDGSLHKLKISCRPAAFFNDKAAMFFATIAGLFFRTMFFILVYSPGHGHRRLYCQAFGSAVYHANKHPGCKQQVKCGDT